MVKNIVIVDAVRSAVGRAHKGSLANKRPDELAGEVIRALYVVRNLDKLRHLAGQGARPS